jgi:uncharacterized repeat protein (TIGR02543 family)
MGDFMKLNNYKNVSLIRQIGTLVVIIILLLSIAMCQSGGLNLNTIKVNVVSQDLVSETINYRPGTQLLLNEPSKPGYSFDGWYHDVDFSKELDYDYLRDNPNLFPKLTPIVYNINYELDNGSISSYTYPKTYTVEEYFLALPTARKTGFSFVGWFDQVSGGAQVADLNGRMGNLNLYARFIQQNYTLSFIENGGSDVSDITARYNQSITLPTPVRTGYTFGGWYSDVNLSRGFSNVAMPADTMFLFAKWNLINYTISYNLNGGSLATANPTSYTYETNTINLISPTRSGSTFGGWYTNPELSGLPTYNVVKNSTGNLSLFAKWDAIPITPDTTPPTVFYIQNGLTGVAVDTTLIIAFSEPIRNLDNSEINNANVAGLITLKETNASGDNVEFTATINSNKQEIYIVPNSNLNSNQTYYYSIGNNVEDGSNNQAAFGFGTFVTFGIINAPTFTINPINGSILTQLDANIIVTFDQGIRYLNNSSIVDGPAIKTAVVLNKLTAAGLVEVASTYTFNNANNTITINPDANLDPASIYSVSIIGNQLEGLFDNAIATTTISKFYTNPIVTFSPTDDSINIPVNSNITVSFSDIIRLTNDTAITTDTQIKTFLTIVDASDVEVGSGTTIYSIATVASKSVITINPFGEEATNLAYSSTYRVKLTASIIEITTGEVVIGYQEISFTTVSDPNNIQVTFTPVNATTEVSVDTATTYTITFSNPIRLDGGASATISNIVNYIVFKENNSSGANVAYTVVSFNGTVLVISPNSTLKSNQLYHLGVLTGLETTSAVDIIPTSSTFTTAASVSIINATTTGLTVRFNGRVRYLNNASLNGTNIQSLLDIRNSSNTAIAYSATLANNNTDIIVTYTSSLVAGDYTIKFNSVLEYQTDQSLVPNTLSDVVNPFTIA